MQLEHSFTVPAGIEQAWQVLLDIERVAPCMPGASLDTVDGDDFTGTVKVRLGPIGLTYKGKASFVEKDAVAHRVIIDAQGKDARGNGTASAKVTATLEPDGEQATKVVVLTDLNITGKPAQFGRGVMVDVGNKLIGQFADCLAGKLSGTESAPAAASASAPAAALASAPEDEAAASAEPAVAGAGTAAVAEPAAMAGGSGPAAAEVSATRSASPLDQPTPAAAEIAAGEPVVGSTEPAAGAVEPAAGAVEQPAGSAEPAAGAAEQPAGSAEPAAGAAEQPATDVAAGVQATADSTAPGTDPLAPTFTEPAASAPPAAPPQAAPQHAAPPQAAPQHAAPASEVEPIDLLSSAGPAVAKRLAPVVAAALLAILLFVILRRRR